ncbi:MAG: hypothetical protein HN396_04580 [Gemmatimonadales bacterium]|jgi:NTP pyrophosphatase (non-canonical NTP hydrolase)|nr:hypothetical protein [Gemmatimonadales bacterium]
MVESELSLESMDAMDDYQAFVLSHIRNAGERSMVTLMERVIGLSEECGEVSGVVKSALMAGRGADVSSLSYEVGDVLAYLVMICDCAGFRLSDAALNNASKLAERTRELGDD